MQNKSIYQVNPLTRIPGGYHLFIEFSDGSIEHGHNIKSPFHYIKTVISKVALEGIKVSRVTTGGDEVVFANGEFDPKFTTPSMKSIN